MDRIFMIAAMSLDRVIGLHNGHHFILPWGDNYSLDRQHFREVTLHHTVIMGRNTFDSIGLALPQRTNIVVTSHPVNASGIEVAESLQDAIALSKRLNPRNTIWLCGGSRIYRDGMNIANNIELTVIPEKYCETDSMQKISFPEIGKNWERLSTIIYPLDGQLRIIRYVRTR